MASLYAVGVVLFSSFGCMAIGVYVHRTDLLGDAARKGVATLYARLVFPTMVFAGVADIDLHSLDRSLMLVMLTSKALLAALVVAYAARALKGREAAPLAHAGALAMAASHSFDVTLGVPLCKVLFPSSVAYIYLNQSVQLVLVNPILLVLMETGGGSGKGGGLGAQLRGAVGGVATNPLVVMTVLGLLAGQIFGPGGLPVPVAALAKQVASAGPFLGFLCLGFALAGLSSTSAAEMRSAAVLNAAKLVVMPLLYTACAHGFGCSAEPAFLSFVGTLPASASVYSLTMTKQLSPRIVGPLVPASMLLCVALCLLPLSPAAEALHATAIVRALIAACGVWGLASVSGTASSTSAVGGKKAAPLKRSQSPGKKAGKKSQ